MMNSVRRSLATLLNRARSSSPGAYSALSRLSGFLNNSSSPDPPETPNRTNPSGSSYCSNDNDNGASLTWNNRPVRDLLLLGGCDLNHWLVVFDVSQFDEPYYSDPSEENLIHMFVKMLAPIVGSEEEAKKSIYSVCTLSYACFYGIGVCLPSDSALRLLKDHPHVVSLVLPDSYNDIETKEYAVGCKFVDGEIIPPIVDRA